MNNYYSKYKKYKLKYEKLQNKYNRTGGLIVDEEKIKKVIDIIELYNKAFNSYVVYRFRFNHMFGLIPFLNELSDFVHTMINDENVKKYFKNYYVENFQDETDRNKRLFSLRQQTTKIIKQMLLKNKEAEENINKLKLDISNNLMPEAGKEIEQKSEQDELMSKCNLISLLVSTNDNFKFKEMSEPKDLDILRNLTNKIIYKLGTHTDDNEKNNSLNCELNNLFNQCFGLIKTEFDKLN
jgi:hypothetical protein